MDMEAYTNQELAEMHYMYGAADGNARLAQRLYQQRYPNRQLPDPRTFQRVHHQLCESGRVRGNRHNAGRGRHVRTPELEEAVLDAVEVNPRTSTRAVAHQVGRVSHTTVWNIVHEQLLYPYHLQRVQALNDADYALRVQFAQWFLQQTAVEPAFPSYVLFTDEATFTREGVFNVHNSHVWSQDNPHGTRPHAYQQRYGVNVWAGIIGDVLIGPYLLPHRLNGQTYRIFLEEQLPDLLDDVPLANLNRMWFQHDGAPAHFSINVRQYLDASFGARWIGRGGPVAWPPRSPDLTCLDFFLWGHMKNVVYETPVDSYEDLVARIAVAAGNVNDMPGIFVRVQQSMLRRCEACVTANGRTFEHLL